MLVSEYVQCIDPHGCDNVRAMLKQIQKCVLELNQLADAYKFVRCNEWQNDTTTATPSFYNLSMSFCDYSFSLLETLRIFGVKNEIIKTQINRISCSLFSLVVWAPCARIVVFVTLLTTSSHQNKTANFKTEHRLEKMVRMAIGVSFLR